MLLEEEVGKPCPHFPLLSKVNVEKDEGAATGWPGDGLEEAMRRCEVVLTYLSSHPSLPPKASASACLMDVLSLSPAYCLV